MVEIDVAHSHLVEALVRSFKPESILELGFGGGRSHNAIAQGAKYNGNKPTYTLVDSWHDWSGNVPPEAHAAVKRHSLNHKTHDAEENTFHSFTMVTSSEEDFVSNNIGMMEYNFIMSDADHQQTHKWAIDVFERLLTSPGLLIYHDVNGAYPGLGELPSKFRIRGDCASMVFNRKTRDDEECERGLLVIYKY